MQVQEFLRELIVGVVALSDKALSYLDMWQHPVGQILTATNAPALLLVEVCEREAGEWSWRKIPQCLRLDLILVGEEDLGH